MLLRNGLLIAERNLEELIGKLWQIFSVFFRIGAFTFGGGYAMIPLIQKEMVERKHWVEDEDILEVVAIAESTPGPIAVNASTFIGYRVAGFWGAFFGTFGMILPSFVIILVISFVLRAFQELRLVQYAFMGIRAGVLALMLRALFMMYRQTEKSILAYIVMAAAFVLTAFWDINVLWVIIGCAVFGAAVSGNTWLRERLCRKISAGQTEREKK